MKLTVPVKYVKNDNITPFSRVDCTRASTIMPGMRRSNEIPLTSLVCTRDKQHKIKTGVATTGGRSQEQRGAHNTENIQKAYHMF